MTVRSPQSPALRYDGDAALETLLRAEGIVASIEGLKSLVSGVLAAPEGEDPDAWMVLVAEKRSAALTAQLKALKARLGATVAVEASPTTARLAALRSEFARQDLDGFIVPRSDEHQNEYVPPRAERLAWLTGFTGSAGLAIVLKERAAVFVDGRYTLQVADQVDRTCFETRHIVDEPPSAWIEAHLGRGGRLGYDPWLHTPNECARFEAASKKAGGVLSACKNNPIDAVWRDQPVAPVAPVVPHELRFAGESAEAKRRPLASELEKKRVDAAIITAPDSIAWLLNIRGGDVPRTPLVLSFAILERSGQVRLFLDPRKLTPSARAHLGNEVAVAAIGTFPSALDQLKGARVLLDPGSAPAFVAARLEAAGAELVKDSDPCQLPKARKNAAELDGARAAHARDGLALVRFLAWLDRAAAAGEVSEMAAVEALADFRREGELFRDFSFDTISGAGANGAIVHYRVSAASNRRITPGELYLVDSGAQYLDGTTDVTRTVFVAGKGEPSAEQKDRFTRVLKGHIALARARFPKGTSGSQLDALARHALWQAGLDYDHGTGHGVGSYLGVHEGPHRISKIPNTVALEPGMIVSNEPGYYKTGAFGIRIENLVAVVPSPAPEGAERELLGFETLTLAPIDRRLIETTLLDAEERAWLDAYHARVRETHAPHLDAGLRAWLVAATAPLPA
ncbi:MAG: aminopeptidase P family protein [Alphaproteobacteria bacterium]